MWEVNSPSSPKVERTLPANYTTEFGSRAPFIKLLGVLEGKGQNYIAEPGKHGAARRAQGTCISEGSPQPCEVFLPLSQFTDFEIKALCFGQVSC